MDQLSDTPRVDAVVSVERFYADQELIDLARAMERELEQTHEEWATEALALEQELAAVTLRANCYAAVFSHVFTPLLPSDNDYPLHKGLCRACAQEPDDPIHVEAECCTAANTCPSTGDAR